MREIRIIGIDADFLICISPPPFLFQMPPGSVEDVAADYSKLISNPVKGQIPLEVKEEGCGEASLLGKDLNPKVSIIWKLLDASDM